MINLNRYDIAPTVINFTRSLLVSFAKPLGEVTDSGLSNTKGAEGYGTVGCELDAVYILHILLLQNRIGSKYTFHFF